MGKKDVQREEQNFTKMLESIPFVGADWDSNEITVNKLTDLLIKQSDCLNKLAWSLIALTAVLALVTITDMFVRIAL